jgi:hypothetical protein
VRALVLAAMTIGVVMTGPSSSAQTRQLIVSQRNTRLAVNAWDGAKSGALLRLHNGCSTSNADCMWTFRNGMIVSERNSKLAINAWGGAKAGVLLRLSDQCQPSNPDCTWTFRNGMFLSNRDPNLAISASGGAIFGAVLALAKAAPGDREELWAWK